MQNFSIPFLITLLCIMPNASAMHRTQPTCHVARSGAPLKQRPLLPLTPQAPARPRASNATNEKSRRRKANSASQATFKQFCHSALDFNEPEIGNHIPKLSKTDVIEIVGGRGVKLFMCKTCGKYNLTDARTLESTCGFMPKADAAHPQVVAMSTPAPEAPRKQVPLSPSDEDEAVELQVVVYDDAILDLDAAETDLRKDAETGDDLPAGAPHESSSTEQSGSTQVFAQPPARLPHANEVVARHIPSQISQAGSITRTTLQAPQQGPQANSCLAGLRRRIAHCINTLRHK